MPPSRLNGLFVCPNQECFLYSISYGFCFDIQRKITINSITRFLRHIRGKKRGRITSLRGIYMVNYVDDLSAQGQHRLTHRIEMITEMTNLNLVQSCLQRGGVNGFGLFSVRNTAAAAATLILVLLLLDRTYMFLIPPLLFGAFNPLRT